MLYSFFCKDVSQVFKSDWILFIELGDKIAFPPCKLFFCEIGHLFCNRAERPSSRGSIGIGSHNGCCHAFLGGSIRFSVLLAVFDTAVILGLKELNYIGSSHVFVDIIKLVSHKWAKIL